MVIAGVRPGSRDPFVAAKGPKTTGPRRGPGNALRCSLNPAAGKLAELALRHLEGLKQRPPPIRASIQGAEQQASDEGKRGKWKFHVAKIAWLGL